MRILLVDDDEILMASLAQRLIRQRYAVDIAVDGSSACDYVQLFSYDLIVLDLMLPDGDGIDFCRRFRRDGFINPLMILTAKESTTEKVTALDAGADDYVVKPFDFDELCARIRALLRREHEGLPAVLQWGEIQLDPSTGELTYAGELVRLTPKELSLMELFLRQPYRVHSLGGIMDDLWPLETPPGEDTIRTHIKSIRRKLRETGAPKNVIRTVYGLGYRLNEGALRSEKDYVQTSEKENLVEEGGSLRLSDSGSASSVALGSRASGSGVSGSGVSGNGASGNGVSSHHSQFGSARLQPKRSGNGQPRAPAGHNLSPAFKHHLSAPDDSAVAAEPKVTCHYLHNALKLVTEIEKAAMLLAANTGEISAQGRCSAYQKAQAEAQKKARTNAHKLAGSLGSFGFSEGSKMAQLIEQHLKAIASSRSADVCSDTQNDALLNSNRRTDKRTARQRPQVPDYADTVRLIQQLRRYIETAVHQSAANSKASKPLKPLEPLAQDSARPPVVLIVSEDSELIEQIVQAAEADSASPLATFVSTERTQSEGSPPALTHGDLVIWDYATAPLAPRLIEACPTIVLVDHITLEAQRRLVDEGASRVMRRGESPLRIVEEVRHSLLKARAVKTIRVAIADDDPDVLSALQTSLSAYDLVISTFADAQSLWQWLHRETSAAAEAPSTDALPDTPPDALPDTPIIDALILDIEMPGMNGLELCRVLRADAQFQHISILFLTVHDSERMRDMAFQAGADDFISKADVTPQELASRIRHQRFKAY